jgi:hypothetical protein
MPPEAEVSYPAATQQGSEHDNRQQWLPAHRLSTAIQKAPPSAEDDADS